MSLLALALVVPGLTACGLFEDGGNLDDALDLVPFDATFVEFVDRAALAERLDIEDADPDDYLDAVAEDPVGGTELVQFLSLMADGAAFDERDVEWSVTGQVDDGVFDVYKLDDDVDLGDVADDLLDLGYDEEELRDRRRFTGRPASPDNGGYPPSFFDVTIDDDEHLVVMGSDADAVLETLDDDADSATDADTFDEVLDGTDDVELALLTGAPQCAVNLRATPEQLAAASDELGDIRTPSHTAFLISGEDSEQSARLEFSDDDEAEADLDARRTYLEEGVLLATRQPFADVGSAELERDGALVKVGLDLENPRAGRQMAQQGDGFLVCKP